MPCGGIYPVSINDKFIPGAQSECFVCLKDINCNNEKDYLYFCEEWDCWMHPDCLREFQSTEEFDIVVVHNHVIEAYANDILLGKLTR